MRDELIRPVLRFLVALTVAAALYAVNLGVGTYVMWDANQGERSRLAEQNQQLIAVIQQAQQKAQQQQGKGGP